VARFEGKVVAGIFLRFQPGGLVEYAAGHSIDDALYLKPNDLAQWKGIEWARGQGFRSYSLGGSGPFIVSSEERLLLSTVTSWTRPGFIIIPCRRRWQGPRDKSCTLCQNPSNGSYGEHCALAD
jgi:hypothetical protein